MSSVTNTGWNLLPLCTSNRWPTNSGTMVQARAHVRIGTLTPRSLACITLRNSFSVTNGPFFDERDIAGSHTVSFNTNRPMQSPFEPARGARARPRSLLLLTLEHQLPVP